VGHALLSFFIASILAAEDRSLWSGLSAATAPLAACPSRTTVLVLCSGDTGARGSEARGGRDAEEDPGREDSRRLLEL
jgi:hypothetical protein